MTPHKDETQSEFMGRCVPDMIGSGDNKRPQEQAVAACLDIWRNKDKSSVSSITKQAPDPDPDESHSEFLDRCTSELTDEGMDDGDAEDACQIAWDERGARAVVQKTHAATVNGMEFVLSDDSIDRMGDSITTGGWQLDNYRRNPVALGFHNPEFVVGRWHNLRVEGNQLRGHLELAPKGTSPRIDEIRKLVEAGILKAVSVGFKPVKHEPLNKGDKSSYGGIRFLEQELVETSLVSVPANANALAVAKSLKVSPETINLVFAEQGKESGTMTRRAFVAEQGATHHHNRRASAMPLGQRIQDVEAKLIGYTDELEAHLSKMNDDNVSDAEMAKTNDLNAKIAQHEGLRDSLVEAEKRLARTAGNGNERRSLPAVVNGGGNAGTSSPHVILHRKKELDPLEYLVRAGTAAVFAKDWARPLDEARTRIYGDDEMTKAITDIVLKAASAPAMTTVPGWAQELAQQTYSEMMPLLMPDSILRPLSAKGLSLMFGQAAKIVIPTRSRTPSIAGSFVGEGNAIPVRQGAFTSQTLTPKKVAVISVFTREMSEHSIPAIEGIIREAIQQDTSVAVDSVLIDANPATTVRPAGLLNGVAAITPTVITNGAFAAIVGDIKNLLGALTTNLLGNVRNLVFLMNPTDVLSASLVVPPNTGQFPFKADLAAGTLNGIPVIKSSTVPVKTLILMDAADFVVVGGDSVRFEMSDQATLHMEDTTPVELVSAGSPGTVASPQRSLFQTDSIALRMIMPLNWIIRRTGTVAWVQNITW
jgi:HK97 family phage major capsid protein/HK97 family phage prohead protease